MNKSEIGSYELHEKEPLTYITSEGIDLDMGAWGSSLLEIKSYVHKLLRNTFRGLENSDRVIKEINEIINLFNYMIAAPGVAELSTRDLGDMLDIIGSFYELRYGLNDELDNTLKATRSSIMEVLNSRL